MGFVPLICRCYVFLYIRLPFNASFWEVPKHTLFASQKKREVRLSWVWYTILFFFSKAVVYWIPCYHFRSLLQEQRVSFFNFGCHYEFSVHPFCLLFATVSSILIIWRIIFIVLGSTLGFIMGFTLSFGVHLSYLLSLIPACVIYLWQ